MIDIFNISSVTVVTFLIPSNVTFSLYFDICVFCRHRLFFYCPIVLVLHIFMSESLYEQCFEELIFFFNKLWFTSEFSMCRIFDCPIILVLHILVC